MIKQNLLDITVLNTIWNYHYYYYYLYSIRFFSTVLLYQRSKAYGKVTVVVVSFFAPQVFLLYYVIEIIPETSYSIANSNIASV